MPTVPLPLDVAWYKELRSAGAFFSIQYYLRGQRHQRERQRQKFLAGQIRNPHFTYPQINPDYFRKQAEQVAAVKATLVEREATAAIRKAYVARIDEITAVLKMLEAVGLGDSDLFGRCSKALYGTPAAETFSLTLHSIHRLVNQAGESPSRRVRQAAHHLQQVLPPLSLDPPPLPPHPAVIQQVFSHVLHSLAAIIPDLPAKKRWYGVAIRDVLNQALRRLQLYDWSVIMNAEQYYFSVQHTHKEVRIPAKRRLSDQKLRSLIVHEIGTHVVRRVNGLNSPLRLLGAGLDHYEVGEEGVATIYEEAISGRFKEVIRPERYLAIGLAWGLDGQARDFRGVYDVLYPYFFFRAVRAGLETKIARQVALERAWQTCGRIFRGTDGRTSGVCLTKDIMYQDGNLRLWRTLEEDPTEVYRFPVGKYDPANAMHRSLLTELKILPDRAFLAASRQTYPRRTTPPASGTA